MKDQLDDNFLKIRGNLENKDTKFRYKYQDLGKLIWRKHISYHFSPTVIAFYFYLVETCDKGYWKNPFSLLALQIRLGMPFSEDTIFRSKRILMKAGLLYFYTVKGSKVTFFQFPDLPVQSDIYPEGLNHLIEKLPKKSAGLDQTSAKPPTDLPHDLPKKSAGLESTHIYNNKHITQTHKEVCEYFGFNEKDNPRNWNLALEFVRELTRQNKIENFIAQFSAYRKFKAFSKEKKHGFQNFIGNAKIHYENGGWDSENWVKKLQDINDSKQSQPLSGIRDINKQINRQTDND